TASRHGDRSGGAIALHRLPQAADAGRDEHGYRQGGGVVADRRRSGRDRLRERAGVCFDGRRRVDGRKQKEWRVGSGADGQDSGSRPNHDHRPEFAQDLYAHGGDECGRAGRRPSAAQGGHVYDRGGFSEVVVPRVSGWSRAGVPVSFSRILVSESSPVSSAIDGISFASTCPTRRFQLRPKRSPHLQVVLRTTQRPPQRPMSTPSTVPIPKCWHTPWPSIRARRYPCASRWRKSPRSARSSSSTPFTSSTATAPSRTSRISPSPWSGYRCWRRSHSSTSSAGMARNALRAIRTSANPAGIRLRSKASSAAPTLPPSRRSSPRMTASAPK